MEDPPSSFSLNLGVFQNIRVMKKLYLLVLLFIPCWLMAQQVKVDKKLQAKVQTLLTSFKGDVGVYIKSLKTGKTVAIDADTIFPTASMVKIPILLGMMDKLNSGEYQYYQELKLFQPATRLQVPKCALPVALQTMRKPSEVGQQVSERLQRDKYGRQRPLGGAKAPPCTFFISFLDSTVPIFLFCNILICCFIV